MITTSSPPPKAARYTCAECGLVAPAPIVVRAAGDAMRNGHPLGRCASRPSCARRKLRTHTLAKQPEAPRA